MKQIAEEEPTKLENLLNVRTEEDMFLRFYAGMLGWILLSSTDQGNQGRISY